MQRILTLFVTMFVSALPISLWAQLTSTNLPIVIITTPTSINATQQQGTMNIINNASGVNNINDVPRTHKWKDEQAYSEKSNREFEEKEAREKIQKQKNAEANKQQYQAKALYTGYNSEYKLKIEVQANVIYVLEENVDLLNQNKRVLYKNEIAAEALYYRFPQNSSNWNSASSGSMYNCGYAAFDACISVNGMVFELGNPTYID